jgi:hypothetical protein
VFASCHDIPEVNGFAVPLRPRRAAAFGDCREPCRASTLHRRCSGGFFGAETMSKIVDQAAANRHQVVVEQLLAETAARASEWAGLSRKAKIEAWVNWQSMQAGERIFHRFDRILQATEEVV